MNAMKHLRSFQLPPVGRRCVRNLSTWAWSGPFILALLLIVPCGRAQNFPTLAGPWSASGSISAVISAQGASKRMTIPVADGQTIDLVQNGSSFSYTVSTTGLGGSTINARYYGTISRRGTVSVTGTTPGEIEFLGGSISHFTGTVVASGPLVGGVMYLTNGSFYASTSYEGVPITLSGRPDIILTAQFPLVSITAPISGAHLTNNAITVSGTAGDAEGVQAVYYQVNDGGWTNASTDDNWADWTASVTLSPGANIISAYSVDYYTSSPIVSVECYYTAYGALVVRSFGNGAFSPNDNAKSLEINKNYTLKAIPGHNWIFSNWVGGATLPYAVLSTDASYTFSMVSNLVLQANFVPNPFIPEQGTFNGLFLDTNDVAEASSGFFTLALTTTGAFTGKIMTSGSTYNLPTKTKFDAGGQVEFTIHTRQNSLTFNLQLDISDPASQQITGTVSDGAWTADLNADRAVFTASANKAADYEGKYTLAIAGSDDPATSPGGFGCATLSVSSAGLITMTGNLADGTAMSQSVSVSKDGRWPFYAAYATPPAGNGGAVLSWITFSNQPASALGGTMYWFRPAAKTPAVYQSGFTNIASVVGSAYNPTAKPLLALTNGQVTLDSGDLPYAISNQITLTPTETIIVPHTVEVTNKLALTINKTTGAISGSFANPSDSKQTITVKGVLLQNQTNAAGYFLDANQSGAFLLENP